jgi:hypothetical protein
MVREHGGEPAIESTEGKAAMPYPISLTPRFSEVHGGVSYHNPESFRGLPVH